MPKVLLSHISPSSFTQNLVNQIPELINQKMLTYLITVHEHNGRTDKQDYYGSTALCTKVHRMAKVGHMALTTCTFRVVCHSVLKLDMT